MKAGLAHSYSGFLGFNCPEDDVNYINTITANTTPDLDKYGPDCFWEGKHWVRWYNLNKSANGKAAADIKFSAEWQKRQGFGHELTIASSDVEFRNMVVAEGLNNTVPDLSMIQATGNAAQTVIDVAGSAADAIKNVAAAGANATDAAATLITWLPLLVLGAAILVGFIMWNKKTVNIL